MRIKELEQYTGFYDFRDQLKRWVYERSLEAFRAGDSSRDAVGDVQELERRQAWIRQQFLHSIGGLPEEAPSLEPDLTGTIPCDGYRIEKVLFHSRNKTAVSSNLYIPDGLDAPTGAVLFLSGHFEMAKHHPDYQCVCQHLVRAGLVVLAIDPIGQGERLSYYEPAASAALIRGGVAEHDHVGSQCLLLGDSLARYFLHDAMRAVDYLCTRPEVDPARIGVTGNSGGGTQTSMMMLADPRIAAAAPATFIMNRRTYLYAGGAQDAEQIWPGFSSAGLDHEDILLAMAPKPVLVLAVKYDFFPIEGTRETVDRTRRFWEMYGREANLRYVEDTWTHRYTEKLARAAAQFFSEHLLRRDAASGAIRPMEPAELWCTGSGQVHGADSRKVYHENIDRAAQSSLYRAGLQPEARRDRALGWLRDKVLANREHGELNPRLNMVKGYLDELSVYNAAWWSQKGIMNYAWIFRSVHLANETLPVTIAVWDGGTHSMQAHIGWIRTRCAQGYSVMVLDVSGVGILQPHALSNRDTLDFYEIIHKLACDLIWLNDSLAAVRVNDVLRAVDVVKELPLMDYTQVQVYAYGKYGVYGLLAASLDERIEAVSWEKPLSSYEELVRSQYYDSRDISSILLPGILSYCDLPELRDWCGARFRSLHG
ncbi:acetylxylan esterase [Paenibacillus koleovorans]|uniref:acetylxylan esterase n=1 Tax=Paenibacillus koleovorans TaxID=121608 RepID=UPI000FD7763D|nr:acetylxylan esterase [Paenibacillus koleovorans]